MAAHWATIGIVRAIQPIQDKLSSLSAKPLDESGATAIEYGLIAALISVVIITAVRLVGTNLTATFNAIAAALK